MKKAIVVITVICLIMSTFAGTVYAQANSSTGAAPMSMQILGKKVSSATPPIVKSNRVYLPLRTVGEALGYQVSWSAKSQTMELTSKGQNIRASIGYGKAYVNGKYVSLDAVPIMYNERLYIPLTFVQKYFSYTTTYDSTKKLVTINKKAAASNAGSTVTGSSSTGSASTTAASKGIYVLGKKMSSTDLPIVKNNKVYVPLRHIGEGLGYKVTWNAGTKTMELKSGSSIKVVINNGYATINGKKVKMDAVPVLYNGRAYVTTTFIQSNFDYDVKYDASKKLVQVDKKKPPVVNEEKPIEYKTANIDDIVYDDNGGFPQLNIVADNPVQYTSFFASDPTRLVIDIKNSLVNTDYTTKEISKGGIIRARIEQFSKTPDVVRVVVELEDQKTCKLVQSNDKKSISLIYANLIYPVSFAKEGDNDVLTVRGSQELDTSVFKLSNPERLVIDLNKSVLSDKEQTVDVKTSFVKSIRTGQVDVGVARVVLDLEPNMYYDVKQTGNLTKVYISNIPFTFVDYKKYYNSAFINLNPGKEVEYQPIIDNENKILKIMIPKDLDVEQKTYNINDNVMEYVTVTKETHGGQAYTVAAFKMKDLVEYELLSPAVTKLVSLKFKYKAQRPDQLTVIIDAGHGGKDPGATAVDKSKEKDLNLDVANRLNNIMKGLGFKTIMTRTDDSYVDLASRSGLANSSYADFFMSIHFNAFMSSAKGIETLYFPNDVTPGYPTDNKAMADIFHNELIDTLKRPSRGITPRPGLHVLNKTKMPAILAELGFITNPEEYSQIKKPEYREMAARALATSIVRYFKEIEKIDLNIDTDAIYSMPLPQNALSAENTAIQAPAESEAVQDAVEGTGEEAVVQDGSSQQ
ncbi:MAG: stalk domain-containing protein [Caulobacteraceae bacterium]